MGPTKNQKSKIKYKKAKSANYGSTVRSNF
jgi:hypothetical protein